MSPTSTMKENPLQYRVRGTPVPTTQTRGTNYPKSTLSRRWRPPRISRSFIFIFFAIFPHGTIHEKTICDSLCRFIAIVQILTKAPHFIKGLNKVSTFQKDITDSPRIVASFVIKSLDTPKLLYVAFPQKEFIRNLFEVLKRGPCGVFAYSRMSFPQTSASATGQLDHNHKYRPSTSGFVQSTFTAAFL